MDEQNYIKMKINSWRDRERKRKNRHYAEILLNNAIWNISRVKVWFRSLVVLTAKPWTIGNFAFQGTV